MRVSLFLFLLLSLSCSITDAHPWGDLSHRHRRSDDEPTTTDAGKECFFAKKRTTTDEKEQRPTFSKVSEKCNGKLTRLALYLYEVMNIVLDFRS